MSGSTWDNRAPHRSSTPVHLPTNQPIRVTAESDGELLPRMYSYWSNAWIAPDGAVYVFVGHSDGRPMFFKVTAGVTERFGPLLTYSGTGEGWYWDREGWIYLCDGPRLRRVDPLTGIDRVVFDISETHPGCRLWQAHSSDDGQTHSATVQLVVEDGPYRNVGTVCERHGSRMFFTTAGMLDESQVTRDGRWLVIKEGDDNRIIDLETGETRLLLDSDGAVGHSDCGDGILVGEDNIHGECVLWDLGQSLTTEHRRPLFSTWNMGYVSVRGGRCLWSSPTHLSLVALDGSGVTPLLEHGGGSDYDSRVKANLDPSGHVATYTINGIVYLLNI